MSEKYQQVVFVTQLFPPEKGGNASRIHDTTTNLYDQYWEPTVLSPPPCYPPGEFNRSWKRSVTETVDGVTVHRLWTWQPQAENPSFASRLLYYLLFGVHATLWLLWNVQEYDLVVTSTPPVSTGAPGLLAALLGKPWVVDIRDLWIDAAVSLGFLSDGGTAERISRKFQHTVVHTADRITVTTKGISASLQENYGKSLASKITVIPNGVDTDRFEPASSSSGHESSVEEPECNSDIKHTLIYTGNLGIAQDLESCIRAIPHLAHENVCFRIVGSGDKETDLKALTADLGITDNVVFTGVVPRDEIPRLLRESTIGLAPIKRSDQLAYAIPTKLYEYMASGLPTVVTGKGEIERFVLESGGGIHAANDPKQIADRIDDLLADNQKRQRLSNQGREHVENRFDRRAITTRFGNELHRLNNTEEVS